MFPHPAPVGYQLFKSAGLLLFVPILLSLTSHYLFLNVVLKSLQPSNSRWTHTVATKSCKHTHTRHTKQVYCALQSGPGRAFWFKIFFFLLLCILQLLLLLHLFITVPFYSLSHQLKTYKMDNIPYSHWPLLAFVESCAISLFIHIISQLRALFETVSAVTAVQMCE